MRIDLRLQSPHVGIFLTDLQAIDIPNTLVQTIQHGIGRCRNQKQLLLLSLCRNTFLIITICDEMERIHNINNLPLVIEKNPLQSSI